MDFVLTVLVCVVSGLIAAEPAPRESTTSAHAPAQVKLVAAERAALPRKRQGVDAPSPQADDAAKALLTHRLVELEAKLDAIHANKKYRPLFEATDGGVIRIQAHFSRAQKAVHDGIEMLDKGESFDHVLVDTFHNCLGEYLINLEKLPASEVFGTVRIPDKDTKSQLIRDVQAAQAHANKTAGFEEVALMKIDSESTAREAVIFAQRSLMEVYVLLDNRTLTYVTGPGIQEAKGLRAALDAAWQAIDGMVDVSGQRVILMGKDDKPLADQLAPFRKAMKEARKQARFFREGYLPTVWKDEQRERAQWIEARLAEDGFERRVESVKALKTAALEGV